MPPVVAWICEEVLQPSLQHHSGVPLLYDAGAELQRRSGSMELVEIPEHMGNRGGLASGCQFSVYQLHMCDARSACICSHCKRAFVVV